MGRKKVLKNEMKRKEREATEIKCGRQKRAKMTEEDLPKLRTRKADSVYDKRAKLTEKEPRVFRARKTTSQLKKLKTCKTDDEKKKISKLTKKVPWKNRDSK